MTQFEMQASAVIKANDSVGHIANGLLLIGIVEPPNPFYFQI